MKKIMFNDKYGLTAAVLEGRKTMTRRVAPKIRDYGVLSEPYENATYKVGEVVAISQPYKEVYPYADFKLHDNFTFMTESAGWDNKMFVKSCHMPHHIRITDIKVERLKDISDEDCLKEGITKWERGLDLYYYCKEKFSDFNTPREAFAALTDKVSGKGTWESNPWVFAYTFELKK